MSDNEGSDAEADVMDGVAVIGMSGRFPGAESIAEFWESLKAGAESVTTFSDDELLAAGISPELVNNPNYVKKRGLFKNPDMFDAAFFGITPREAELMDPQHRVFLESCWHTLEAAGYAPRTYPGPIGVWGGMSTGMTNNTYLLSNLHSHPDVLGDEDILPTMLGNENDYLTTRVSYKLNLSGPSVNLQTACSTSLVAITNAYQSLMTYGCDMALAGGVSVSFPQAAGYLYQEGDIGSPDGHCRPFDAQAQGTVFSNGVGVVLLKRLEDALEDGDTIYAVVRGAAMNNDGAAKVSFAAPSVDGQAQVIATAQAIADVDPESVTYVECHGTGTPIGDPIEVSGLTKAFGLGSEFQNHCGLGSVKSNFGHLDSAAGVAAFIKTVLCLHNKTLVPTLHYEAAHPNIDLANSPFYVCTEQTPWDTEQLPRRAGVSGFGIGGTNVHLVMEEAPTVDRQKPAASEAQELLILSAKTKDAVKQQAANLADHLESHPDLDLADIAHTLQVGREQFRHRLSVLGQDKTELINALRTMDKQRVTLQKSLPAGGSPVFMFPGGGSQYVQMGRDLYAKEPVFRQSVDKGLELFGQRDNGVDLRSIWFAAENAEGQAEEEFRRPSLQLPAIFIAEMALTELWASWGIEPEALIGHSLGENTAACVAGVLSYEEALGLVSLRGELFETVEPGGMLSVALSKSELLPYLGEEFDLATVNGPNQCTVSGTTGGLSTLEQKLQDDDVEVQLIPIAIAAHSRWLEPILDKFRAYLQNCQLSAPTIPLISNYSGNWLSDEQACDPNYWVNHLRNTVLFGDGVNTLLEQDDRIFLEVGPGKILGSLVKLQSPQVATRVIPSLRHPAETIADDTFLKNALGRLWAAGIEVDWELLRQNQDLRRVALPVYPFQRKRYLVEPVLGGWSHVQGVAQTGAEGSDEEPAQVEEPVVYGSRGEMILAKLSIIIHEMSGIELEDIEPQESFLDMGFDSLFLTQANLRFKKEFKVKITFRQLFDDAPCLHALAEYIDQQLPEDAEISVTQPAKSAVASEAPVADAGTVKAKKLGPYVPIDAGASPSGLSEEAGKALNDFIAAYNAKTPKSKELSNSQRPYVSDPRSISGFRVDWKELVYQLAGSRSKGSRIWDIDGNEYLDVTSGFGSNLMGYSTDSVIEALKEQVDKGFELGTLSPLAKEAGMLVRDLTGMDRVTFTNTGSESLAAAVRAARTTTGKEKIAVFYDEYHGISDELLVNRVRTAAGNRTVPTSPGIPQNLVDNVIVLEWGDDYLEIIRQNADELAAIIIEPVQNRNPSLKNGDKFPAICELTKANDIALVFDEMITGFRLHPGGAQAYYGVEVDMCCYGKIVSGGMPLAMVVGRGEYLDVFDGGPWEYGDESFPEAGVTFFGGTYTRHPLSLAGCVAALRDIKALGKDAYEILNSRSQRLANQLNEIIVSRGFPARIENCASIFNLRFNDENPFSRLIMWQLKYHGILIYDRPFFISMAHTDEDFEQFKQAFRDSIDALQSSGIVPATSVEGSVEGVRNIPMTDTQQEVWLATCMGDEASRAFHEQVIYEIDQFLDIDAMRHAVQKLVFRHEGLRATLLEDDSGLAIHPSMHVPVPLIDISDLDAKEIPARLELLYREHLSKDFDLHKGPLIRVSIVKTAENVCELVMAAHHLVIDGWSMGVMLNDLAEYYKAACHNDKFGEPAGTQLSEFTAVEREEMAEQESIETEEFWLSKFSEGVPEPVALPLDRPRPAMKTYHGQRIEIKLSSELTEGLKTFSNDHHSTLFTTLYSAFSVLLYKLTGQNDQVIGVPVAGQAVWGVPDMVGHCVSFLPFRAKLDPSATFKNNLSKNREIILDANDYQRITYKRLLERLNIKRDPSQMPLTNIVFNVDQGMAEFDFNGAQAKYIACPRDYVKYDLFLNLINEDEGLSIELDYNSDIFDADSALGWGKYYQSLLEEIIKNSDVLVGDLSLLDGGSRERIATQWNDTDVDYPLDTSTLISMFEGSVVKNPEAVAIEMGEDKLSYAQLNEKANQLARYLQKDGVKENDIVAVLMERSVDMVVSLYGILKSGAAYLPLDIEHPNDRVDYILRESSCKIVLCQAQFADKLSDDIARLAVDENRAELEGFDTSSPACPAGPDSLAYVIYTSGSTGNPKGVMIEHRGICNRLFWMQDTYSLSGEDKVLQKTPYTFDVSVWEFFWPLQCGATLVVAEPGAHADNESLVELINQREITVAHFVPSMLRLFLLSDSSKTCTSLRDVICSGEALTIDVCQTFYSKLPGSRLHNLYGPTEAAVDVTSYECKPDLNTGVVPIGRPIANTKIYILDASGQLVPDGCEGEIYIAGIQLARGYLNQAELTAERFVQMSILGVAERMYRTGDLGRYREDGSIDYIGRNDFQVKLRGLRIELGEIESALCRHDELSQSVVVVNDSGGDQRLVAYYLSRSGQEISVHDLRAHLLQILPLYMLPQYFVVLDKFPLTTSGKLDRKALPLPAISMEGLSVFKAPESDLEVYVANIWCDILGVEKVGLNDDFFEMGGHSLLAVTMLNTLSRDLEMKIPVRVVFENPQVAGLVAAVEGMLVEELENISDDEAEKMLSDD